MPVIQHQRLYMQASRRVLWAMPAGQLAFLLFFSLDAWWHFWYNAGLYALCFIVGGLPLPLLCPSA